MTVAELKKYFTKGRAQSYAWPGGYPVFFLTSDGETMCPDCVTKNRAEIIRATGENSRGGWAIAAVDVNWEDLEMFCCECSKRIESAYAEDQVRAEG